MKAPKRLNPIQVAASAAGAVLAAVIASFFGVEGTIIGTAVGSIVATTVSAVVWESIERGHDAVRQVVVERGPVLHRGSTESAGEVTSAEARASAVEAQVDAGLDRQAAVGPPGGAPGAGPEAPKAPEAPEAAQGAPPVSAEGTSDTAAGGWAEVRAQSPLDPTRPVRAGADASGAATGAGSVFERTGARRLLTSSRAGGPAQVRRTSASTTAERRRRGLMGALPRRWVLVGSIVGVFALALGIITVIEALAGQPMASLVTGTNARGGLTLSGGAPAAPTTSSTTTTSTTTSTTTPPTTSTTTTSTTTPSSVSTTTTSGTTPSSSSTTSTTAPPKAGTAASSGTGASGG